MDGDTEGKVRWEGYQGERNLRRTEKIEEERGRMRKIEGDRGRSREIEGRRVRLGRSWSRLERTGWGRFGQNDREDRERVLNIRDIVDGY